MPSEKRTFVRPVKVEMICDCGAPMQVRQQTVIDARAVYDHVCTNIDCGRSVVFDAPFPRIDHEEVQQSDNGYVMILSDEGHT